METIISGRERVCKDSQGGVSKVWLLPYKKHPRSEVRVVDSVLTLFPSSDYYLFETYNEVSVTQGMQENDGGKFVNYSLTLNIDDHEQIREMINFEYRAVVNDRIGNYIMLGLTNGLQIESINKPTGISKSDFNGYEITLSGIEEFTAPYLTNITDLDGAFLLQETGDYLLQENLGKIPLNG